MNPFTFWFPLGLLVYCYGIYPVMVITLARLFPRPVEKAPVTPSVTLFIPAYNEEEILDRKIENTLSLDYPPERLQIVIVSDGSTDRTVEIAAGFANRGVECVDFRERRGKVPALLGALDHARGEILVFSDASGMLERNALREMIANFADERVGAVCGYYRSPALSAGRERGELFYWGYEFSIKRAESRWRSLLGATGAMYAVRRETFVPPPIDTINDDFVIPALVVAGGHRAVLEEKAVVEDQDPSMGNFRSRVRVAAGNWQQLVYCRGLLSLKNSAVAWEFLSHKCLRMIAPVLLFSCAVTFAWRFSLAAVILCGILLIAALPWRKGRLRLFSSVMGKFIAGNIAALYGMVLFCFRKEGLRWR